MTCTIQAQVSNELNGGRNYWNCFFDAKQRRQPPATRQIPPSWYSASNRSSLFHCSRLFWTEQTSPKALIGASHLRHPKRQETELDTGSPWFSWTFQSNSKIMYIILYNLKGVNWKHRSKLIQTVFMCFCEQYQCHELEAAFGSIPGVHHSKLACYHCHHQELLRGCLGHVNHFVGGQRTWMKAWSALALNFFHAVTPF